MSLPNVVSSAPGTARYAGPPRAAAQTEGRAATERSADDCKRAASVVELVAGVAAATPGAVALRESSARLSYGDLNASASRLAGHLRSLGIGAGDAVGICLERSFEQIVAILAVLQAGGAFLPLDPAWPEARIRTLLDDARAPALIGKAATVDRLAAKHRAAVALDRDAQAILQSASAAAVAELQPDDLAYVIYTSGSTGEPKGVEITHGNLMNLVLWHQNAFGVTAADRASHLAGLGFDAAVWEIWPYLTAGASVSLAPEAVRTSPDLLRRWLLDEQVTIAFVPTALAEPMLVAEWPANASMRVLLTGADTLHTYPSPGLPFAVVNNYGPTECAVVATSGVVPPHASAAALPSIGRPIANTRVHILNEQGEPAAPGEPGEIHIGGMSVGRGYRNRADLTAERFVADRFADAPGGRLYRTGDLGCWLPTGEIGFCGRLDDQQKIRGHRVAPDEIARALNRHPLVASSAVVARGAAAHEKRLVAYILPAPAGEPTAQELRNFLATFLPSFMIPAAFVRLAALPLSSSGKLDKTALPDPSPANTLDAVRYRAPGTATEQRLAEIIGRLLGIERVGADDNFFLMGGHSLLGTQVVMRARDAFGVDLTLRHLFEAQTVAKLAAAIEELLIETLQAMSEDEARRRVAG